MQPLFSLVLVCVFLMFCKTPWNFLEFPRSFCCCARCWPTPGPRGGEAACSPARRGWSRTTRNSAFKTAGCPPRPWRGRLGTTWSELAKNESVLRSVNNAVRSGIPTIAECAGFMYLHESMYDITGVAYKMAGVIDGKCYKSDIPIKNGYIELISNTSNLLLKRGGKFKTYEYHVYESTDPGSTFTAVKNGDSWKCINSSPTLYAGFPHLHFYTNMKMAEKFMRSCVK